MLTTTLFTILIHLFLKKSSDHLPQEIKKFNNLFALDVFFEINQNVLKEAVEHVQFLIGRGFYANKVSKRMKEVGELTRESS